MMNSSPKKINWGFYIFFIPVFLWLLLLFILPQLELLRLSFVSSAYLGQPGITLSNYVSFFDFPVYWITCARTVGYSVVLTLVVLLVALPVAFYITKVAPPKLKGFLGVGNCAILGQRTGQGVRLDDDFTGKWYPQPYTGRIRHMEKTDRIALQRCCDSYRFGSYKPIIYVGPDNRGYGQPR